MLTIVAIALFCVTDCFAQTSYQSSASVELSERINFDLLPDSVKKSVSNVYHVLNEHMEPEYRLEANAKNLQVLRGELTVRMIDSTSAKPKRIKSKSYVTTDTSGNNMWVYYTERKVGYIYLIGVFSSNGVQYPVSWVSLDNTFKIQNHVVDYLPQCSYRIDDFNCVFGGFLYKTATFVLGEDKDGSGFQSQSYIVSIPAISKN